MLQRRIKVGENASIEGSAVTKTNAFQIARLGISASSWCLKAPWRRVAVDADGRVLGPKSAFWGLGGGGNAG